jgi:hypothetical protein
MQCNLPGMRSIAASPGYGSARLRSYMRIQRFDNGAASSACICCVARSSALASADAMPCTASKACKPSEGHPWMLGRALSGRAGGRYGVAYDGGACVILHILLPSLIYVPSGIYMVVWRASVVPLQPLVTAPVLLTSTLLQSATSSGYRRN